MKHPSLADLAHGRNNNFNLLRFVASLTVVITHAIALATGNKEVTALHVFGRYVAMLAPDVFFVISGYLITASLMVGQDAAAFVQARVLRIGPPLVLVVALTVFVLGPAVTTLPLQAYFQDPAVWRYLLFNTTQLLGARDQLPGVFTDLPYPNAVNGSLWTLTVEVRLYLALLLLWWLSARMPWGRVRTMLAVMALATVLLGGLKLALEPRWSVPINSLRLAPLFTMGSLMYLLRERIPMHRGLFWLCLGAMLVTMPWFQVFFYVEFFTIGYVVLYLGHVPRGKVLRFNEWGDMSYGVYVYSFPLQQLMVLALPGIGPWGLIALSLLLCLPLAWCSWHGLEKPALALKRRPRGLPPRRPQAGDWAAPSPGSPTSDGSGASAGAGVSTKT